MRVTSISLENFRNYEKVSISTDADLVLIVGENAAGKTNLLESIYYLSRLKSFRAPDLMLTRRGTDYFSVTGNVHDVAHEAIVQFSPKAGRVFKSAGQKTKRGLWNAFRTVLFVPNDLNLFILGPVLRRKFLDETLTQKSAVYNLNLTSLEHILKQRSALLQMLWRNEGDPQELEFWNKELARVSLAIRADRLEFVNFLQQRFSQTIAALTGFEYPCDIVFETFTGIENEQQFLMELARLSQAEIRSGKNLLGPHRDDFTINKDGELNIYNSSRGELRAQILALKLLQAEYLIDGDKKPVILLDDVFSELDEIRRNKLLESLIGHQIFITTTEEVHLPTAADKSLVLKVKDNSVN